MFNNDTKNSESLFQSKCFINTAIAAGALLSLFLLVKTIGEVKTVSYIGKSPAFQNIISVSGKADVTLKPDIATFTFSVNEESQTVATAQSLVTRKVDAILADLKKIGVDSEKDIKTVNYNIYPRYEYAGQYGTGKRTLAAYNVTQTIEVKARKIEDAGKLISSVASLGATDVSGLTFDLENRDEVIKNARAAAIADARKEADRLAKDLGVNIVRMTSFSEGGYYPIAPMYYGKGGDTMSAASEGRATVDIPTGQNKITSTVVISYEIK